MSCNPEHADLLCIPDRDVWAYGQALRAMAVEKGFTHIEFSRLRDLTEIPLPEKLEEIIYVANATNFRRCMLNRWGRDDINVDDEIANNPDTLMTYRGYSRFLQSDLQHVFPSSSPTLASGKMAPGSRSVKAFKRDIRYLGKQMIMRGYAFAGACKHAFPNHLRLSIHMSTGEHKISMSLLDTKTGFTTPWHCSIAQLADGEWISAPKGDFETNPRMEVVYENGRPSYFREKPEPLAEAVTTLVPATDGGLLSEPQLATATSSSTPSVGGEDSGSEPLGSSTTISDASSAASVNLETPAEDKEATSSACGCKSKDAGVVVTITEASVEKESAPRVSTASNEYGKRLIPHIIDDLALNEPDRITYSIVKSADVSQGMVEISAKAMAQAVDKAAWWLQSQIGETSESQMVGYIGPHDLRYVVLTYACIKAGHQILFLSPKNSVEGAMAVLNAANCNFWAQPSEEPLSFLIEKCLDKRAMSVLNVPTVDELLDAADVNHFPYNKTWEEAENDIYCVLHTSGSTGLPKPIRWTHGLIGTMDAVRLLPPAEGDMGLAPWTTMFEDGDRIYSSFPMSHGAGTIMNSLIPAYFRMHCVMGPSGVIPNMDLTASLADHAKLDVWSIVPSLVDQLGETPEVLAKFKSAKFICASGGEFPSFEDDRMQCELPGHRLLTLYLTRPCQPS